MSARRDRAVRGGGALIPLALGLFVALRLGGVTHWSWWWVLSPLWIAAALGVLTAGVMLGFFALLGAQAWLRARLRFRQSFPEVFIDPAQWSRRELAEREDDHR
jgi:hypothetical protein